MTASSKRNHPHDLVFRFVFVRVAHARAVLRALVGVDTARQLDWSSMRLVPGTYVEEALRDSMSDVLFSVRFRGSQRKALVYLLWDHQRRPDRMMPLRLHNYGGRALQDYTHQEDAIPGYVPTLIPVLVYQGPGEWPGPYLLSELSVLPGEPAPPVHMDLRMIVHELQDDSLPPEELTTLARTTFRLLRLAALGQLVAANAARIAVWLHRVHDAHGYADFRALLEYIGSAGKEAGMIQAVIEHLREDVKDSAMNTIDSLRAEGWKQGLEQGLEQGRAEARALLLRMLERRFGTVPPQVRARVLTAEQGQLEEWALRMLTVGTLAEVLGDP